jgi:hypothetical protein
MRKLSTNTKFALSALGILTTLILWAKLEHQPSDALVAVRDYIEQEAAVANMDGAAAATNSSNPITETIPPSRLAACKQPNVFAPFQTNGNRFRSLLLGRNPDQDAISIDFADCSVRFFLQRQANGSWQINRVHSHAG